MENELRVPRLLFIDNLKILTIVLVIAAHVSLAYGPGLVWWYFENPDRALILRPFYVVNRGFLMSLFFMISGYFLPSSYDRKGAGAFLKDRLLRLGVPLLVFFLAVIPVITYAYYVNFRNCGHLPFPDYYSNVYFGMGSRPPGWTGPTWPDRQLGHLWFVQHLLIFAVFYAIWRLIRPSVGRVDSEEKAPPGNSAILVFTLVLAAASFIVRIWHPIYEWRAFLGFIQVSFADVLRDLSFFIIGVIAYRRNWLLNIARSTGRTWLLIGLAAAGLCYGLELTGHRCLIPGGLNWPAFRYNLWEAFLCSGLCIGLLVLFRENFNRQGTLARDLVASTYAVYLFHLPIVVFLQYAIQHIEVAAINKFVIVSVATVPLAFLIGSFIRRLPFASRVL